MKASRGWKLFFRGPHKMSASCGNGLSAADGPGEIDRLELGDWLNVNKIDPDEYPGDVAGAAFYRVRIGTQVLFVRLPREPRFDGSVDIVER